jgi:hypothetical protein
MDAVWHFNNFGIKTTVQICPIKSIPFSSVIRIGMAGIAPGFLFFFGQVECFDIFDILLHIFNQ